MMEGGWQVVITHGNGPQVGFILRRNELAAAEVHPTPLDLIVADTQGSIGFMLQQTLNNEFYQRHIDRQCITFITQTRVEPTTRPSRIPPSRSAALWTKRSAREFEKDGWQVMEDAGRGWRRVVASPEPVEIIEEKAIAAGGCHGLDRDRSGRRRHSGGAPPHGRVAQRLRRHRQGSRQQPAGQSASTPTSF